ncbi:hypothetical protein D8B26_007853 [Coccidioides posadasii str. Silveira]|uniref:Uncharacterized protein n=3 Tax=Coccidioides posadasii TaxID=199306 RepID=E9D1H5_COCPS|nr:hypothetical protein CPC735_018420 [Coccidioides posadasii C735 delta SOWgp]EER25238.1 hypothetical protein CPC735_018420 [Coccidioides posadasii C735 delta SOWgp]EFW19649.1 conserved hypothetical protein [Coccidioides posadasii str. Silveira]KMM72105.1 hypothetical protein CPAG_08404 [Coccidioides posadasii RMSCC 3488]QVM13239.1 hypothetical protein D8B26_007853 [Coccidioides posadasii str. Silveira]|eukprot:XP_003067383.1 hypothetical protein CPC735_018420 [Coccidioides posadasii C735 delta SOWgp]
MSTSSTSDSTKPLPHSEDYLLFKRYASITFVVAAPILIALPPRKLDLYSVSLASAFFFSANYLTADQTGKSIMQRLGARFEGQKPPSIFRDLPTERAEEVREQIRRAREAARQQEFQRQQAQKGAEKEDGGPVLAELGKKIWMGEETEGWKEKRMEEERKALEEGKGYGDLIMDHIRDAIGVNKYTSDSERTDEKNAEP